MKSNHDPHLQEHQVKTGNLPSKTEEKKEQNTPSECLAVTIAKSEEIDSENIFKQLSAWSVVEYEHHRKEIAEIMEVRVPTLDSEVGKYRIQKPKNHISVFEETEPFEEEVDGATLLNATHQVITRHLVLPLGADIAITLWVVLTYCFNSFKVLPLLGLWSPEKRCGKTICCELLQGLVCRPIPASNITSAALYRVIEKHEPTMLIDEADTFLNNNSELRGILNSGHRVKSAFVMRCNSETNDPESFSTWCPKALFMIGDPSETLRDRSIPIRITRKAPDENVTKMARDFDEQQLHLRRKYVRYCQDNNFIENDNNVPPVANDRALENWGPLLAIADQAGGEWPERTRQAMVILETKEANDQESVGQLLLADIRQLFMQTAVDKLFSADLVMQLLILEGQPWSEWNNGRPITQNSLAELLKTYRIRPKTIRMGVITRKGYEFSAFTDAFARYLPQQPNQQVVTL